MRARLLAGGRWKVETGMRKPRLAAGNWKLPLNEIERIPGFRPERWPLDVEFAGRAHELPKILVSRIHASAAMQLQRQQRPRLVNVLQQQCSVGTETTLPVRRVGVGSLEGGRDQRQFPFTGSQSRQARDARELLDWQGGEILQPHAEPGQPALCFIRANARRLDQRDEQIRQSSF